MTTEPEPTDPPEHDPEILAAEALLGLQDPAQLASASASATPAFNHAVDAWAHRLGPLLDEVAPVAPPPRLWPAIQAAIAAPGTASRRPSLWNNLPLWRGFGFGAGILGLAGVAAAVAMAVLLNHPVSPIATATLATPGSGAFIAVAQRQDNDVLLLVTPARVTVPAGKAAELWLLLPGAKPQPLGLLASQHAVTVKLASAAAILGSAQLAISLEPPGGSPSGTVTGPVIASAKFSPV